MKTQSFHERSVHQSLLRLAMAIVGSLVAAGAQAQVPVIDVTSNATNKAGFAAQLAKTIDQYKTEVDQYQQLLMTVQGLGTNISITQNHLTTIDDPSPLIDQSCPGASGGSVVGSLVNSLASNVSLRQPITVSQQQVCAQLITVEVDEYNRTVGILNQLNQYGGTLQKLNSLANKVNSLGSTSGATTQAAVFHDTMAQSMSAWQSAIAGDEALIKSLNQQQAMLSRIALNGSNTILGHVVQATALEAALAIKH